MGKFIHLCLGLKLQQHPTTSQELHNTSQNHTKHKRKINPMTTQPYSPTRRIRSILPVALASVLILGAARLVFDHLKSRPNRFLLSWSLGWLQGGGTRVLDGFDEVIDIEDCNVFEGKWVWDNKTLPLYEGESCPYLGNQVTCQRNGRLDDLYKYWRWQPNECNLPRFNAIRLLERLRNKRLMFVGDSIQRGQFDSMVCLLQSAIPEGRKLHYKVPPKKIFLAKDYNATVEFYWAPFIVESNSDHSTNHSVQRRLVKLDSVSKHSKNWEGVDFLVFESYIWWMFKPMINATSSGSGGVREYSVVDAYKVALQTWARWLEASVDPDKQRVFFMSLSPTHLWRREWSPGSEGNCFNETTPIEGQFSGAGSSMEIMNIVRETLQGLKIDVTLMNITQLSEYRKDAHTTVYGERRGKLLNKEERANPNQYADCIHWCLPGVPDTWNEILYAHLLQYS